MPLYMEILDQDRSTVAAATQRGSEASVLSSWTSDTTGETVRLIDAPGESASPRATLRILFC
jgi:hypothetical protein